MKRRNIISILLVLTIIFTIMGGSLAYFTWQTSESQKTEVTFTVEKQFSCSADGGGNITSSSLVPTSCNSNNAIKRTIKVKPQITGTKTIYMELWLDVKEMGEGLVNSNNLKYVLSTSSTSCETGVVSSGNLRGKTISLLSSKEYTQTKTDTYYLYIWLDKEETSPTTQNQKISLSLNGSCDDENQSNAPKPELNDFMIPVVFDTSGSDIVTKTISKDDPSWYNYRKKEWANVVLTTDESKYLNTSGVSVSEDDILAYYVWIPRYKYKIWTTTTSSKGKEQTIDIVFENNDTPKSTGTTIGSYRTHPAFTFGDAELNGIWVGKFETTGTADAPTIKPNDNPLTNQSVSEQDTTSQWFNTSGSDSHVMKNSEWGAAAYLTYSIYGINSAIGKHGDSTRNRAFGTKASTTGNITGIYGMSGMHFESVMANYNNTIGASGFNSMPEDSKYYDLYTIDNIDQCTIESCGGHALFETAGWYGDNASFVASSYPWFLRDSGTGRYDENNTVSVFNVGGYDGSVNSRYTFRFVLSVLSPQLCSTLNEPDEFLYPECYKFSVSNSEKTLLVNFLHSTVVGMGKTDYTLKDATTDFENMLNNGSTLLKGFEDRGPAYLTDMISTYNEDNEPDIIPTSEFIPTRKVRPKF